MRKVKIGCLSISSGGNLTDESLTRSGAGVPPVLRRSRKISISAAFTVEAGRMLPHSLEGQMSDSNH